MVRSGDDVGRLVHLLRQVGDSDAAAKVERAMSGGGSASGGSSSRGSSGSAPPRFGSTRGGAEAVVDIDMPELARKFNPTGFEGQWTLPEVARVADALPELELPFSQDAPGDTLAKLDELVFQNNNRDTTAALVAADVSVGNKGYAVYGDCYNTLEDHLWALSLILRTGYKVRPMHSLDAFDVSSLYKLRSIGETRAAPIRSPAADARFANIKFLTTR